MKEQLFNAYIVETPEGITYSYHWTLAWNLQKKNKIKIDLYNLRIRIDLIFLKSLKDYKLQSKSKSLRRNLVNTFCLCMKILLRLFI